MSQRWAVYSIEQSEFVHEVIRRCKKAGLENVSLSLVNNNIHYNGMKMKAMDTDEI
jgi:hypothetical protein